MCRPAFPRRGKWAAMLIGAWGAARRESIQGAWTYRAQDSTVLYASSDYWEVFVLKHRHPGNLVFHGVSGCVFYGLPIAAAMTGNPWWLCGLPLSSIIGVVGHAFFEPGKIDLQDALFSWRTLRCLNRMFWRLLTGRYSQDIREMTARMEAYRRAHNGA